jgi:hypothetical protein
MTRRKIKSQLTLLLQNRQDRSGEVPLDLALVPVPEQHGMFKQSIAASPSKSADGSL